MALNATIAYILLALSTVLVVLFPGVPLEWRFTIARRSLRWRRLWVYVMFTRSPRPRQDHPVRMAVYMVGLLGVRGAS